MLVFIELHSVPRIVLALNHELFYLTSTVPATATPFPRLTLLLIIQCVLLQSASPNVSHRISGNGATVP